MNRLLRISFDTFLTSITPILTWTLLGILVDKNLINIFTLIYPLQYIVGIIRSVFGIGANISAIRDNNKESVFTGIVIGMILGVIIFGCIVFNIDKYIIFMNMNVEIYKTFAIYATIQIFLQLLLNLTLAKLYFEEKNKRANKYTFFFNLINLVTLIGTSLITKNQVIIAVVSTIFTSIFVIVMILRIVKVTKFKINILNCIKYDSFTLFTNITMFVIYLFGFKNSFNFGEKYILAISFSTLITDAQWDIMSAMKTVAQIDIAKKVFSYKEHLKNACKLTYMLIGSSILMGLILYPNYQADLVAIIIIAGAELMTLYAYPFYLLKLVFIQIELSAIKATMTKEISQILRIVCSFLPTPFCTTIGLIIGAIYQFMAANYIVCKNKLNMEMKEKKACNEVERRFNTEKTQDVFNLNI